jgi:hypothetical protein
MRQLMPLEVFGSRKLVFAVAFVTLMRLDVCINVLAKSSCSDNVLS